MGEANLIDLGNQVDNQRGLILRTVETYPDPWIVVHEALQNGLDAVQRSPNTSGHIQITINMDEQRIKVRDDGVGFIPKLEYLGLGGTDKSSQDWNLGGNIGVGLTVVILSTKQFEISSVFENKKWTCQITDAYKYLTGESANVPISFTEPVELVDHEDSHTEIIYSFPDNKVVSMINQVYADTCTEISGKLTNETLHKFVLGIEHYFRTQSYAGNVSRLTGLEGCKPTNISITMEITRADTLAQITDESLKELLAANPSVEVNFENKYWDMREAIGRARPGTSTPAVIDNVIQPGGRVGGPYSQNYVYVKSLTTEDEFKSLLINPHLKITPDVEGYQSLFNQLSSIYMVIGSVPILSDFLISDPTQFIAASGIPSAHLLDKPSRGGELGYLANMHVILNVKSKLNYGKQTITNTRLVSLASRYFNDSFRATLKNVAKEFVGSLPQVAPPLLTPPTDIITRQNLGVPSLSIVKEPIAGKEQEVIALFYELIGQKYFTEFKTYALSSFDIYDGRVMIRFPIQDEFTTPTIDEHVPRIEFKVHVSDLISDFEEGKKRASDLALVVAWVQDYQNTHQDYEVIEITGTSLEDYGLQHVSQCLHQRSSGNLVQILVLRDVINGIKSGTISPSD